MAILKRTGVIRRMDDLGRIVFPKNIRTQINAQEGDAFELCVAEEGGIKFFAAVPYRSWSLPINEQEIVRLILKQSDCNCLVALGDRATNMTRSTGPIGAHMALARANDLIVQVVTTGMPAEKKDDGYTIFAAPIKDRAALVVAYNAHDVDSGESLKNSILIKAELLSVILA